MTLEQMDRAIAEHLGDPKITDECEYCDGCGECGGEADAYECRKCGGSGKCEPRYIGPTYSTDLDAMHKAEASLPDTDAYIRELQIVTVKWRGSKDPGWLVRLARATAEQRAKAFLRAIGKYQEDTDV